MEDDVNEKNRTFSEISEGYIAQLFKDSPESATYMGVHDYDHLLADYSADAERESLSRFKGILRELETMEPGGLSDADALDYELLINQLEAQIRTSEALPHWERVPGYYASSPLSAIFMLVVREFAPLEERLRSISERLTQVPRVLDQARANLKNPPRVFTQVALETARGGVGFYGQIIPSLAEKVPTLAADVKGRGRAAAEALEGYAEFLEGLLERSEGDFAIGRELFDLRLGKEHFLSCDSEALLGLGHEVFDETVHALNVLAREIRPETSWLDLVTELKGHHPTRESLKSTYAEWMTKARDFVRERDIISFPDNESLEVIDTPAFYRSVLPYAAYMPPAPFERDQKGFFFVTPVDGLPEEQQEQKLRGHCLYTIPVIALHEAYPGHHLQLSIGNGKGTRLRRFFASNVFAEGWALYCEELMDEIGFYGDRETKLFQLKDQLWRAARVIIDVSLHTRRMTYEEAIRFLVDRVHLEEPNATAEVKRYTGSPTQPMSYIAGKKEILELRSAYQVKKGPEFDLKEFHDRLLSFGTVPPKLVRDRIL
jgi:uncharacterized protein (DUF885 family)